jgi:hypothetical protein
VAALPRLCLQAKAKPEKFQRWRAVEIKHGRIAMAATVGACHAGEFRNRPARHMTD